LPINPKTRINKKGKIKLNTIAEGLRKIARKLPLVMAIMALNWLYAIKIILKKNKNIVKPANNLQLF